jgi:hypothetical protein
LAGTAISTTVGDPLRAVEVEATSTDVNEAAERLSRVRDPASVLGEGDDRWNEKKQTTSTPSFKAEVSRFSILFHGRNYPWSIHGGTIHGLDFGAHVFSGSTGLATVRSVAMSMITETNAIPRVAAQQPSPPRHD